MKTLFGRFTQGTLGFVLFLCALFPVSGMGGEAPVVVAKLTPDTPVVNEEHAVFDQHHPKVKAAMAVQDRHTRRLMAVPEVVGTATGLTDSGNPAILIFTRKEVPPGILPASIEGVPTVVKVTGEITALAGKRFNNTAVLPPPVPIGVSTGNIGECSAGTIGARVTKVVSGTTYYYALSNNHVYARENAAGNNGVGDGSYILQPGLYDTQCLNQGNNVIGTLAYYVPINFNTTATNTVDAAIAAILTVPGSSTLMVGNATPKIGGYGTPNTQTISASDIPFGQPVQKYGRTTSLTRGTVIGTNGTFTVNYGSSGYAIFVNQLVISGTKPFSKAGDSGSLIVTNDSHANPVGLLFAGGGGVTIANPIDAVLGSFGVTIDGKTDQ